MSDSAVKLQLVAVLDVVFRSRGYEGATLSELSRACGLGKASLYHHFPGGKDEMAHVLLQRAFAELNDVVYHHLDRPAPWHERMSGFVDGFVRYCAGGTRNCLVVEFTATAACAKFAPEIRAQTNTWLSRLTAAFREKGSSQKRARRQAYELLNGLYGALVLARLFDDPKLFRKTARRVANDFTKRRQRRSA